MRGYIEGQCCAGGQIRTYVCPCGWSCRAQLREANAKMKMHTKYCEEWKNHKFTVDPFIKNLIGSEKLGNGNRGKVNDTVRILSELSKQKS